MANYKIEKILIIGVLALTLAIEVQFQIGIRDYIKDQGGNYLEVYCWNKFYGSGATREIIYNSTGLSIPINYTRRAELIKPTYLNMSFCNCPTEVR